MRKKLIIIFLLITTVQLLNAQNKELFRKVIHETMEIKFKPQYPTSECPNYFIDEIAKAIPKIRMYVKINYQFDMETSIHKQGSKYRLFVKITNITHGGNYKYKDFDFSHLIAPEQIEQTFLINDLSSNTSSYQKIKIGFLEQDSAQEFIKSLKGVITYKVSAKPNRVKYLYSPEQKLRFQNAIYDIDTYYDDALKLDALKNRIEALDFNKADVVALRNVDLKYIEKDLAKIKLQSYRTSLNLESYDPIRLLPKYDSVANMIAERRKVMDNKMGSLDYFYFGQAQKEMAAGNEKSAIEFYQQSITVNPYFSPSIYQLALIDYQHERYNDCFNKIQYVLNDLKPDQNIKKQCIQLSKTVYDSVMIICNKLNNEERFNQSIGILYKTKSYCDSTKYIECDAQIDQYISQAIYGLYASYLSIARASLDKGRLDMCQDYMNMANTFRENNSDKLMGKSEVASQITMELIAGLVQQSEVENAAGNNQKAMKLLTDAKTLCNKNPGNGCKALINKNEAVLYRKEYKVLIHQSLHYQGVQQAQKRKDYLSLAITYQQLHSDYIPTSIGTDTIIGKVRSMMYQEYISNGINKLDAHDFTDAYAEFLAAYNLENDYVFAKDPMLQSYLKEAAKPIVGKILENGNLKAWGKKYLEASLLLDSAENLCKHWDLCDDKEIIEQRNKLKANLKKNVCDKQESLYYNYLKKGNNSQRFNDYFYAAKMWHKAIDIVADMPRCNIDSSQAYLKLLRYKADIDYKTEIYFADSLENNKPTLAFEHLVKAENIYFAQSDEMHNKIKNGLIDLLFDRNNPVLNAQGIKYLLNQGREEESCNLLVFALSSGQVLDPDLLHDAIHAIAIHDSTKSTTASENAELRFGTKKELAEAKKLYLKASRR